MDNDVRQALRRLKLWNTQTTGKNVFISQNIPLRSEFRSPEQEQALHAINWLRQNEIIKFNVQHDATNGMYGETVQLVIDAIKPERLHDLCPNLKGKPRAGDMRPAFAA